MHIEFTKIMKSIYIYYKIYLLLQTIFSTHTYKVYKKNSEKYIYHEIYIIIHLNLRRILTSMKKNTFKIIQLLLILKLLILKLLTYEKIS